MGFSITCTLSLCILVSFAGIAVFSSIVDIWIQTAGCTDDVYPQLEENLEKISNLQEIESKKRDKINHIWNTVFAKQQQFDELERSFHHLNKWIFKLDPLKSDIISLMDVKILNETGKDRREIENQISSNSFNKKVSDVNLLKQNHFTDVEFALSLLINVGSCIVWLVWKYMQKTDDKYGKLESKKNNTKCGYNTAKQIFQVVIGLLILGTTINNIANFDEECRNREWKSGKMINTIVTSTQSMQIIEERMRIFDENVTQNYKFLYDQLKSKEINEFVNETIQLTLFVKDKTLKLAKARHSLSYFYKKFNKAESALHEINYKHVKISVTQLLTGFSNIDYKLDCYRRKRNIINSITRKCASGEDNYENLWENVKNEQGSLEECMVNQKYLSMKEIRKTIQLNMENGNKSSICIRNSKSITNTVCENWLNNMNNFDIINSVDRVTPKDVQEIIKKCLPADVSPNIHDRICYLKSNNASLINTIESNANFNSTQIKSIYNTCSLTQLQNNHICSKKKDGYKIQEIHNLYIYYQEAMIAKQYDSCIAEITPAIVKRICSLSKWNVDNNFHKLDVNTFGRQAVLDILRKEC